MNKTVMIILVLAVGYLAGAKMPVLAQKIGLA